MHIFVNLASEEPARVAKAVRIATKFAKAGWEATILLNVDAVSYARRRTDSPACPVTGKPLHVLLENFRALGTVLVGGDCLEAAGIDRADLVEGFEPTTPQNMHAALTREGTRVFSY
jgi:predicted peroxiredoxin